MSDKAQKSLIIKVSIVAILGPFMSSLDSTVVNISMPILGKEFGASVALIQWVISGYLLALALTLPLSGWLVDRFGAKKVYIWCFGAFTFTSVLCGMADSARELILFRILQGMTGGLLAPLAQMMMAKVAGKKLAKVLGIAVMPVLLAPILGPALAGYVLEHSSWRWLFYLNLPVGLIAIVLAMILLPSDEEERIARKLDIRGLVLLSPGLAFLLYGLENATGSNGLMSFLSGFVLLFFFFLHTKRIGSDSLIDVNLFKQKTFSTAAITQFLSNGVTFSGQMLIPLYLLMKCHLPASQTGLFMIPAGVGMLITYPCIGFLTERFGCRFVSAGGAFLALLATLPFIYMSHFGFVPWLLSAALFFRGVGLGGINIPSIAAAYATVPKKKLPVATTTINIVQRIGGPIATTLLAVFMESRFKGRLPFGLDIFTGGFVLLCFIQLLNVIAASLLPLRVEGAGESHENDLQAMEALTD